MAVNQGVLVYCEMSNGSLSSISTELLGIGLRLASDMGQELNAVMIGSNLEVLAIDAIYYGASKVYLLDDPLLKDYQTDPYLIVMEQFIRQLSPAIVLLGQTHIGRDLTPRLAFRLNAGATLDCIALAIDPTTKRMLMTKPVYGGNAQVILYSEIDPQIATIRSKAMLPSDRDENRKGEVVRIGVTIDPASIRTRVLERHTEASTGVNLNEASVIVTGGRGIGGPEGFKQLEELASVFKGAVGASRPPCDNKWVPDSIQVGLTGKIVSPDIYIAVAVSGSSQHLSGCSGARVIIAINKDPEANIFNASHYGIVADWKNVIPALTSHIKKLVE